MSFNYPWELFKPDFSYILKYYFDNVTLDFRGHIFATISINKKIINIDTPFDESCILLFPSGEVINTFYDLLKICQSTIL